MPWPADALAALGRSLTKWDLCPACKRPAGEHFWQAASVTLECPDIVPQERIDQAEFRRQVEAEERRERMAQIQRAREQWKQQQDNDLGKFVAKIRERQAAAATTGQRRYFDEDQ